MKGRKPKSSVLHLLQGTRNRHKNKNEAKYSTEAITPPSHLNAVAVEEWNRVYGELAPQRMVTTVDRAALAAYCVSYSRWVKAERTLEKMLGKSEDSLLEGMAFKTKAGGLASNPLIRISNQAMEIMLKAASEFGMTPASRSRAGASGMPFPVPDEVFGWYDPSSDV